MSVVRRIIRRLHMTSGAIRLGTALRLMAVAAALQAGASQAPPKPPPPPVVGTGLIMGRVVDSSGAAVANALVTVAGGGLSGANQLRVFANAEGRFAFLDLPAGRFNVTATRNGYSPGAYGRRRAGGSPLVLELADGQKVANVEITLWKHASITGRLFDDAGEALVGAQLWSLRREWSTGRPKFSDSASANTDDRGMFRFSGLAPGDYTFCAIATQSTMPAAVVEAFGAARSAGTTTEFQRGYSSGTIGFSARVPTAGIRVGDSVLHTVGPYTGAVIPPSPREDGRIWSFQTTCYPNVIDLRQAQVMTLEPGEERTGLDMHLELAPGVVIEGTVVGPEGPVPNAGVRLAASFAMDLSNEPTWESALTISDSRGRFAFLGVPAGTYILRAVKAPREPVPPTPGAALPPIPPEPTLSLNMPLVVGEEGLPNLTIRLQPGHRVSGRFVFEGKTPKPAADVITRLAMMAVPADGHNLGFYHVLASRTAADGTFTGFEIPAGAYMFRLGEFQSIPGWTLKAATIDGREVSRTAFDLQGPVGNLIMVMTDTPSELRGQVRDESGRPDPNAAVVVFPVERAFWTNFGTAPRRSMYARVDAAGRYVMQALPAGDYFIAAIDDALGDGWQDPRLLESLSRTADRFTIADAEKKTQDVTSRRPVR
jgi:hypothetical protein